MAKSGPGTFVALLRGINVGGKNKLPMRALVAIFEAAGCSDVQTYIQSGNVVFRAPRNDVPGLAPVLAEAINKRHGLDVPVVLRSAAQVAAVIAGNPFGIEAATSKTLHVAFLAARPTARQLTQLDPKRSPPDEFKVCGREIYLYCPNGLARSKLTNAFFDRRLETTSTVRNWNTVLALARLCG